MIWSHGIRASRVVDVPIARVAEHHVDLGQAKLIYGYRDVVWAQPLRVGGCVLYANYGALIPAGPYTWGVTCEVTLWGLEVAVTELRMGPLHQRIQMNMEALSPTRTRLDLDIRVNGILGWLVHPIAKRMLRRLDRAIASWQDAGRTSGARDSLLEAHLTTFREYAAGQSLRSFEPASADVIV
jgi:hypothetical protein